MAYPSRSRYWIKTANKHGRIVEMIRENMPESCALTLESILIMKYLNQGHPLVNFKNTGTASNVFGARIIYSSLGEIFASVNDALESVKTTDTKASGGNIASAARGERLYAYGRAWSYDGFPEHPKKSSRTSKPIVSSNGEEFVRIKESIEWLRENGYPKASHAAISSCLSGRQKIAYDRSWSYAN